MVHLSVSSRMWSVLLILVISLNGVIGDDYYWRNYNGTIPSDAFIDKDTGSAIAKIYSEKYELFYPTALKHSDGPVIKYEYETITEDIKVLCAEDTTRYSWEFVNADELSKNQNQPGLVEGGSASHGYVYIAKIFIRGRWYIGDIDGAYCYFYPVPDCYHIVENNFWCASPDCLVLKYK